MFDCYRIRRIIQEEGLAFILSTLANPLIMRVNSLTFFSGWLFSDAHKHKENMWTRVFLES